jgi:16S rRNA processing protein RimM
LQAPYGLKGELKLRSYSGEIEHFQTLAGTPVTVLKDGVSRQWTLEAVRVVEPHFLAKFKGLDAPETARKLTGGEILVARQHAAALEPGEYYVADLIGCSIVLSVDAGPATVSHVKTGSSPAKKDRENPGQGIPAADGESTEPAAVTYQPGVVLGTVENVWDNAADDLLTVKLTMGKIVQIPFRSPFVGAVDTEKRTVELLTAWLLD